MAMAAQQACVGVLLVVLVTLASGQGQPLVQQVATSPADNSCQVPQELGLNLLANPGAELEACGMAERRPLPGKIPCWQGTASTVCYGARGFLHPNSPGPPNRGSAFFTGGEGTTHLSIINQTISLLPWTEAITAGQLVFYFSCFMGGYMEQNDAVQATLHFLKRGDSSDSNDAGESNDRTRNVVGFYGLPTVSASDRRRVSGLLPRSVAGPVPADAVSATVYLTFVMEDAGNYNDGYADEASLVLFERDAVVAQA